MKAWFRLHALNIALEMQYWVVKKTLIAGPCTHWQNGKLSDMHSGASASGTECPLPQTNREVLGQRSTRVATTGARSSLA